MGGRSVVRFVLVAVLAMLFMTISGGSPRATPFGIGQACAQGNCKPKPQWICSTPAGNDYLHKKWIPA